MFPGKAKGRTAADQPVAPQFSAERFEDATSQLRAREGAPQGRQSAKSMRQQTINQYKQKLAGEANEDASSSADRGGGFGGGGSGFGIGGMDARGEVREGQTLQAPGPGVNGPGSGIAITAAARAPLGVRPALAKPTGLASLDVQLPTRGAQYFFTTPRGQIEILATTVADTVLARLVRLGVLLAFVLVIGLVYRRVSNSGARTA